MPASIEYLINISTIQYFCIMKDWTEIKSEADVYNIIENSTTKPQIIFKDSTSCGISAHAKERLMDGYSQIEGKAGFNYLDLLSFRPVSKFIAETLEVTHQSPQIIVLRDKKVIYATSHHSISPAGIAKYL
jgi:bacillithiol system protein YtxJ